MVQNRALLATLLLFSACQVTEPNDVGQGNSWIKDGTGGERPNNCTGVAGSPSRTTVGGQAMGSICIQPAIYDLGNAPPSGEFLSYQGCCNSNGTCGTGYACLDGGCVQNCTSSSQCRSGEFCGSGNHCMTSFPFQYHNGYLLGGQTTVYDLFMGADWNGSWAAAEATLAAGTQSIVTDPQFTNVISQYSIVTQSYYGGAYVDTAAPRATMQNTGLGNYLEISRDAIVTQLKQDLTNNLLPQPSTSYSAMYVIHLEDSNVILNTATQVTCLTADCAIHGDTQWVSPSGAVFEVPYAIIPNLDDNSCRDSMMNLPSCDSAALGETSASMIDNMQYAKTHEITEAKNNPNNGGWFSGQLPSANKAPFQFEVSDYCEWYSRRVDGFPASPQWSAADNCCVIARPWPSLPAGTPAQTSYDHQFSQLATGVSADGRIFLFALAAMDHSVWHIEETALDSNQWQQSWTPHPGLSAQQIAVAKESDGRFVVFAIDSSNAPYGGQIYAMRQSSPTGTFGSFAPMNSLGFSSAWQLDAKLDTQSGKLNVFIIDSYAKNVLHMEETTANSNTPGTAPTFNNWVSAGGYALALTLGQLYNGRLIAYVIGGQQQPNAGWLYEIHQIGQGTSGWTGYSIVNQLMNQVWNNNWTTIANGKYGSSLRVATASDWREYVFTTANSSSPDLPSGYLYATIEASADATTWNTPQTVGVTPAGPYVVTNEINRVSFGNGWFTLPDKIDIFYPGKNNGVYQIQQTSSPSGAFGAPIFHGGYMYGLATATSPTSASGGGRIHLFAGDPEFEYNQYCKAMNLTKTPWSWTACAQALVFNLTETSASGSFPQ